VTGRAEQLAAAADQTVENWLSLSPTDRAALVRSLRRAGMVRDYQSGGHTLDVGDPYTPMYAADETALEQLILKHLVRVRALCGS